MLPELQQCKWRDYAGHSTAVEHRIFTISQLDDLKSIVAAAYDQQQPVRLRGNGHSMHGLANPQQHEWLLCMQDCCHYRFDKPGTVTVGAGAAVWDVHQMLSTYGYGLYVYNDGGAAASSVGGYLAAGGFGEPSARHGGFWETVEKVTLVDGTGTIHRIDRNQPVFPWLFGAMGQLGVVFDVRLRIQPLNATGSSIDTADYPGGADGQISGKVTASQYDWEPILWQTLFVPLDDWQIAQRALVEIGSRYRHAWRSRWPYAYTIAFQQFNPPLITPHLGDLAAVGIWGDPTPDGYDWEAIEHIQSAVNTLLTEHPNWRRYIQTEYTPAGFDYAGYFDSEIFTIWRDWKTQFDPKGILVAGVFR